MRSPDAGPLGETVFDASVLAIVAALLVNKAGGGWVDLLVTPATYFLRALAAIRLPHSAFASRNAEAAIPFARPAYEPPCVRPSAAQPFL